MKTIQIKCTGADYLPLEAIINFQGNLKRLSAKNLHKLKTAIIKDGFISPIFVWMHDGIYHAIDGHQRITALKSLEDDEYIIPPLPIVYVDAENEDEAKRRVLAVTSQYGEFDSEELSSWLKGIDESVAETLRLVDSEIDIDVSDEEPEIIDTGVGGSEDLEAENSIITVKIKCDKMQIEDLEEFAKINGMEIKIKK